MYQVCHTLPAVGDVGERLPNPDDQVEPENGWLPSALI
jgi:hypothetical protein